MPKRNLSIRKNSRSNKNKNKIPKKSKKQVIKKGVKAKKGVNATKKRVKNKKKTQKGGAKNKKDAIKKARARAKAEIISLSPYFRYLQSIGPNKIRIPNFDNVVKQIRTLNLERLISYYQTFGAVKRMWRKGYIGFVEDVTETGNPLVGTNEHEFEGILTSTTFAEAQRAAYRGYPKVEGSIKLHIPRQTGKDAKQKIENVLTLPQAQNKTTSVVDNSFMQLPTESLDPTKSHGYFEHIYRHLRAGGGSDYNRSLIIYAWMVYEAEVNGTLPQINITHGNNLNDFEARLPQAVEHSRTTAIERMKGNIRAAGKISASKKKLESMKSRFKQQTPLKEPSVSLGSLASIYRGSVGNLPKPMQDAIKRQYPDLFQQTGGAGISTHGSWAVTPMPGYEGATQMKTYMLQDLVGSVRSSVEEELKGVGRTNIKSGGGSILVLQQCYDSLFRIISIDGRDTSVWAILRSNIESRMKTNKFLIACNDNIDLDAKNSEPKSGGVVLEFNTDQLMNSILNYNTPDTTNTANRYRICYISMRGSNNIGTLEHLLAIIDGYFHGVVASEYVLLAFEDFLIKTDVEEPRRSTLIHLFKSVILLLHPLASIKPNVQKADQPLLIMEHNGAEVSVGIHPNAHTGVEGRVGGTNNNWFTDNPNWLEKTWPGHTPAAFQQGPREIQLAWINSTIDTLNMIFRSFKEISGYLIEWSEHVHRVHFGERENTTGPPTGYEQVQNAPPDPSYWSQSAPQFYGSF